MIDPSKITNYCMKDYEMQKNVLFWLLVAGKTASVIAKNLEVFLSDIKKEKELPFESIKRLGKDKLPNKLRSTGFGCYTLKARGIWQLVNDDLDLRTCSIEDLEKIPGIGKKTSRCFMLHSRKNARYAALDTHILKFLKKKGHNVPPQTPSSKREYLRLEELFLKYADESGKTPAEFDLEIWNSYTR
jgi:thermostable 8-oxoguanine DNA glycosylase